MKPQLSVRNRGFTLLETVIAIGVLAVLLTGFMFVFAPAAAGIKKAISAQEADRLTTALEQELVTLRTGSDTETTGFAKAFNRIMKSTNKDTALMVYQYRADLTAPPRSDGTPPAVASLTDANGKLTKQPGKDYILQPMVRLCSDSAFKNSDLAATEGTVYYVKCTQLIFTGGSLTPNPNLTAGIVDPNNPGTSYSSSDATPPYPDGTIAFKADFYPLPNKNAASFTTTLNAAFGKTALPPLFSRNLAVRR